MTNEEALERLKNILSAWENAYVTVLAGGANHDDEYEADIIALRTAIQMMEKQIPEELPYEPTCKFGYVDCIYDPAYIKYVDPEWYAELYGDAHPNEVNDCQYCKNGSRYDDEDK